MRKQFTEVTFTFLSQLHFTFLIFTQSAWRYKWFKARHYRWIGSFLKQKESQWIFALYNLSFYSLILFLYWVLVNMQMRHYHMHLKTPSLWMLSLFHCENTPQTIQMSWFYYLMYGYYKIFFRSFCSTKSSIKKYIDILSQEVLSEQIS